MQHKDNKRNPAKKRYILAAIFAAFVIAAYLSSARSFDLWPFRSATIQNPDSLANPKPGTPSPKNSAATTKGDTQPSTGPEKTADQVPISSTMIATIITLRATSQEVSFAATVTNSPTAGTCVVTFSNPNDRPVTVQTAATTANGTASCGPLTIPANDFSYLGTWQATFHYYLGDKQATAEGTVTIQ